MQLTNEKINLLKKLWILEVLAHDFSALLFPCPGAYQVDLKWGGCADWSFGTNLLSFLASVCRLFSGSSPGWELELVVFSRLSSSKRDITFMFCCMSFGQERGCKQSDLQILVYILIFFNQNYSALLFLFYTLKIDRYFKIQLFKQASQYKLSKFLYTELKSIQSSHKDVIVSGKLLKREILPNI